MADELAEAAGDPHIVTVIEWADVVQHVLPEKRLTIRFTQTPEGDREVKMSAPAAYSYLIDAVQNA